MPARTLKQYCDMLLKLEADNAPAILKAQCLIQLLIPRMMERIGIKECSEELARKFAQGICYVTGTCPMCEERPSTSPQESLCPKCNAECDQYFAEFDDDVP
jgi:hypothetical protein